MPVEVNKTKLCACKIKYLFFLTSESGLFFLFLLFENIGRPSDGKRNILLGWPHLPLVICLSALFV